MAKLEESRNVGIPVAHKGMKKKKTKLVFLWAIILQVYIQPTQFRKSSLVRSELYTQLNYYSIFIFSKL